MPKYASYVKFTALPGQRDALAELLLQAAAGLHDNPACAFYVINRAVDEPDVVWVTEVWESAAAADAALTDAATRTRIQRVVALLAARPEKISLEALGGKGLAGE